MKRTNEFGLTGEQAEGVATENGKAEPVQCEGTTEENSALSAPQGATDQKEVDLSPKPADEKKNE